MGAVLSMIGSSPAADKYTGRPDGIAAGGRPGPDPRPARERSALGGLCAGRPGARLPGALPVARAGGLPARPGHAVSTRGSARDLRSGYGGAAGSADPGD